MRRPHDFLTRCHAPAGATVNARQIVELDRRYPVLDLLGDPAESNPRSRREECGYPSACVHTSLNSNDERVRLCHAGNDARDCGEDGHDLRIIRCS